MKKELDYIETSWKSYTEQLVTKMDNPKKVLIVLDKESFRFGAEFCSSLRSAGIEFIEVREGDRYAQLSEKEYISDFSSTSSDALWQDINRQSINKIIYVTFSESEENTEKWSQKLDRMFWFVQSVLKQPIDTDFELTTIAKNVHEVTGSESEIIPLNAALFGLCKVIGQEYSKIKVNCLDIDEYTDVTLIFTEAIKNRANLLKPFVMDIYIFLK